MVTYTNSGLSREIELTICDKHLYCHLYKNHFLFCPFLCHTGLALKNFNFLSSDIMSSSLGSFKLGLKI